MYATYRSTELIIINKATVTLSLEVADWLSGNVLVSINEVPYVGPG